MPVLSNVKHERFAQALAAGQSLERAYTSIGYKYERRNAVKLQNRVRPRVDEILSKSADKVGVSIERIVAKLASIAFADVKHDKIKPSDQIKAAELLGRHVGMWPKSDKGDEAGMSLEQLFDSRVRACRRARSPARDRDGRNEGNSGELILASP